MDQLTELAIKYKTDKWGKHNYTPVYYDLFHNKSKRRKVKKVLEIGVAEGAGVRMFRDFFTNAMIYGAEIDDHRIFEEDRIKVFKCDQSKGEDLLSVLLQTGTDLDLVIDDGSHKAQDQYFSLVMIYKYLPKGSIYIIEDVADIKFFEEPTHPLPHNAKILKVGERYDDRLIICQK